MNTLRYGLTPQMRDYDRLRETWQPFVMYFHEAGFSSPSVNTDSRGFRVSTDRQGRALADFRPPDVDVPAGLVVGGSIVFGVGATDDGRTVPSVLNASTGTQWINFGGRAYGSTQELLLYMLYRPLLERVQKVVLLGGVNNLVLYHLSRDYQSEIGSFFFFDMYRSAMNRVGISLPRSMLELLLRPLGAGAGIDYRRDSLRQIAAALCGQRRPPVRRRDHQLERDDLLHALRRDIETWSLLARSAGFDLCYALQPLANWVAKVPSDEERAIFAELDGHPGSHWQVLRSRLDGDTHAWYSGRLRDICRDCGIPYLDVNEEMSRRRPADRWLFVDRIHCTDEGYRMLAGILEEVFHL